MTDPTSTEQPDLTWDQELSQWVPAYRQTRWDPERCPRCDSPQPHLHPAVQHEGEVHICPHPWHEATSSTSLDPLERRISAAILSAYRVPPDVLPAMVERVADAVRPAAEQRGAEKERERIVGSLRELDDLHAHAAARWIEMFGGSREEGAAAERERWEKQFKRERIGTWLPQDSPS